MGAEKNNTYWMLRKRHGREKEYTPRSLWKKALQYFQWSDDNPITVKEFVSKKKNIGIVKEERPRPYTIKAFCLFAVISERTWNSYQKADEDFLRVTEAISNMCYVNKFEGASVGLFRENLISRDLGLAEKMKFDLEDLNDEQIDKLFNKYVLNQK